MQTSATSAREKRWERDVSLSQRVLTATWTFSSRSALDCARMCTDMQTTCTAFSYDTDLRICYIDPVFTYGISSQVHFFEIGGPEMAELSTWQPGTTEMTTQQETTEMTTQQETTEMTTQQETTEMTTQQETTEMTTQQETTEAGCSQRSDYTMMPDGVHCIKATVSPQVSWDQAQANCQADGGRLVVMKTTTKKNALQQVLTNLGVYGEEWWMDADDSQVFGVFKWGDGSTVSSSLFANGQPSITGSTSCITSLWDLMLKDDPCDYMHCYICEMS
ncbi:hypothetical protein BaRGS_00018721 [Batillaria attramentaria]|uniref:C-type lectin domain-containing protein n=1 Tax=Batillaria attramentaria TaxID=370345 RepID=A0ABD0KSI5_9CAEN